MTLARLPRATLLTLSHGAPIPWVSSLSTSHLYWLEWEPPSPCVRVHQDCRSALDCLSQMLPKQNLCGPAILWIVATDVSDRIICAKNEREEGWWENHNVRILVYPQACAEIAAGHPCLPPCVPQIYLSSSVKRTWVCRICWGSKGSCGQPDSVCLFSRLCGPECHQWRYHSQRWGASDVGSQGSARLLSPETAMHVLVLSLVSNVHLRFVKIPNHDLYTSYLEFVFCNSTRIRLWCGLVLIESA